MAKNIYGVQKVKEPEVRDGLDIAGATASATAKGARMGAKFGPVGAVVGGGLLGAFSLANQLRMQQQEKKALDDAEIANEFADNLEGRSEREDIMVQAQARYGMKPKSRYETAEIEGDGSGSANGIGEIHVDKDYNIKNVARGGERHEDGGFEINNLEKEDVIFPTQNNEEEFNRVLGAINRWKLKRDPRAKKFLDRKRDRLPTDEDYGYDKEFPKGKGQRQKDKEFNKQFNQLIKDTKQKAKNRKKFEKAFPEVDYDWYMEVTRDGRDQVPGGDIQAAWETEQRSKIEPGEGPREYQTFDLTNPDFVKQRELDLLQKQNTGTITPEEVGELQNIIGQRRQGMPTEITPVTFDSYYKDLGIDNPGTILPLADNTNTGTTPVAANTPAVATTNTPPNTPPAKTKGMNDEQIELLADRIIKAEETGGFDGGKLSIAEFTANNPYLPGKVKTRDDLIGLLKNHYIPAVKKNLGEDKFNNIDTDILFELTDWNFNSGRAPSDVLAYAAGDITLDKWNSAGKNAVPKNYQDISLQQVTAAKHDGYKTDGKDASGKKYTLDNPNPAYDATWKGRIGHTQDEETYKKLNESYEGVVPETQTANEKLNQREYEIHKQKQAELKAKGESMPNKEKSYVEAMGDEFPKEDVTTDDEEDEPLEEMPFLKQDPTKIGERYAGQYYTKEDGTKVYTKDLMDADKRKYSSEEKEEEKEEDIWDEISKINRYNNPGKYASMINKSIQGSKPIEGVERRFITSDKYKYEDMSAKDRQDNVEARNFQNQTMRGKGLSAGQMQSYGAQNAAQYYSNAERINAAENERRYKTSQANVDLGNRDKQTNLSLANQYDAIERQQRAVKQRYKDTATSDWTKLSQLDEQQRYMMDKDRKMFLRDKMTLPYLGTSRFKPGYDGIQYIPGDDELDITNPYSKDASKPDTDAVNSAFDKQLKGAKEIQVGGKTWKRDASGEWVIQ